MTTEPARPSPAARATDAVRRVDGAGRPAEFTVRQYHNQPATGTLHTNLVAMWEAVRTETDGRVVAEVFAENAGIPGSDPQALRMLIDGEIEFFTLMGGIIGTVVPVAEIQQLPFAFRSAPEAHAAVDGPLGRHIAAEMASKGMHLFPVACFDNGMRQVTARTRPVTTPEDLVGMTVRVPPGRLISETFAAFGAEPVTTPSARIHAALKSGRVDAQENPLGIVEGFRLYEVVRYVSLTNHVWSGFNLVAHLPTWRRLPDDVRVVIERNATRSVRRQRADQDALTARLRGSLATRGLVFNEVDQAAFRARLGGLYATWKERLGSKAWSLMEDEVGKLG